MFSPDGRWVAYRDPGASYIQPFPATGARYQVPRLADGNEPTNPFWSPDGTRLFCPGPGLELAVVTVTTRPTVAFGNPARVPWSFPGRAATPPRSFDILPDGRFIGLIAPRQAGDTGAVSTQPEIHIVLNWFEELKRLVPVK